MPRSAGPAGRRAPRRLRAKLDEAGVGRDEAAGVEVEALQVLFEVDVEPLAACAGGVLTRDLDQVDTHALPTGTHCDESVLDEVVRETGATRNPVVLAWPMSQGISPIVGASRVEQVNEAMAAREVMHSTGQLGRFANATGRVSTACAIRAPRRARASPDEAPPLDQETISRGCRRVP